MVRDLAFDDVQVMQYVANTGLSQENNFEEGLKLLLGSGKTKRALADVPAEELKVYACDIAHNIISQHAEYSQELFDKKQLTIYHKMEKPMIGILARIEAKGAKIDKNLLGEMSAEFTSKLAELEKEIYQIAGHEFNIGSPAQIGVVLFDEMSLDGGKKSKKTGHYSTGADVLEELAAAGHVIAEKILQWRQIAKLKSTYTDSLPLQINSRTGRVHTTYNMTTTSTGRLSSTDPNLQNIPIRTEEGRKIRKAFIAENGFKIISADYSQIELRLLAHVADIQPLKEAFKNGEDIHAATARQVFGLEQVDAEHRRMAKTINFGIIYGQSAFGLAAQLGISRQDAAKYIEQYFKQYAGIKKYMDDTIAFARAHGYVETIFGRKLYIRGINDKNGAIRSFSERAAINAPLQGSAADIIKLAMLKLDAAQLPMILQVHDELLFEVPEASAVEAAAKIKKIMENAASLSVPLLVEANVGNNWGEVH